EARAELGSEALQLVERAGFLEGRGVELDRRVRRVDPRAAARRFLLLARMWRAVGAEEEFRVAGGRGLDQRLAVLLALQHRQAVVMRTDAAHEERVAVEEQVVGGDG